MGFDLQQLCLHIRTSAHNSWRDDRDRNLRDAFLLELEELMKKYKQVGLDVEYGRDD